MNKSIETTFEDNDLLCSSGNLGCMYIVHSYTSAESPVVLDRKPQSHLVGQANHLENDKQAKYLQMKDFIDKSGYFKAIESIITKFE